MTSANLGGFGDEEGPGISCEWSPPGLTVRMLPFLAVLWPLGLRRNRSFRILWVASPLAISLIISWLICMTPAAFPPQELFQALLSATAFGLAAAWLLSPYLGLKRRLTAFIGTLLAVELSGLLVLAISRPWSDEIERRLLIIRVAAFGAMLVLALHLAGLSCRGNFDPARLVLRLLGCLFGCWALALLLAGAFSSPPEAANLLLTWVASSFALLAPFLILSFSSSFFRERLKQLLSLRNVS